MFTLHRQIPRFPLGSIPILSISVSGLSVKAPEDGKEIPMLFYFFCSGSEYCHQSGFPEAVSVFAER